MDDWILNQQDYDSSIGIVGNLDRYDSYRVMKALEFICPKCGAERQYGCLPMNDKEVRGYPWVHASREVIGGTN